MRYIFIIIAVLALVFLPKAIIASNYGECAYGSGQYNEGCDSGSGSSSSSSSSSASGSGGSGPCTAPTPLTSPDLFQINARANSVTIFFTPVNQNRDRYYVAFGKKNTAEEHGFEFSNNSPGVISVNVNLLDKRSKYYFKVRAGNGCMPGSWSNTLAVTTGQRFPSYRYWAFPTIIRSRIERTLEPAPPNIQIDATQSHSPAIPSLPSESSPIEPGPTFFQRISNFIKNLFR